MVLSWDALRAFLAVVDKGTLSGAADTAGVSVATLGRRIDALESSLGLRLLRRGPHGALPTKAGEQIAALARAGAEQLESLERLARAARTGQHAAPVRISSTEPLVADVLAPRLTDLLARHPGLRIELETSVEIANLNRAEADIAVRMVKPTADGLVSRKLPRISMGLFASAKWLARRDPRTVALNESPLLWYDPAYGDIAENRWLRAQALTDRVILGAGSTRALTHAAAAGCGIAVLPRFLARSTGLIEIEAPPLPDREPWLVFHRDSRNDRRMKAVRDWIVEACKASFA